MWWVYHLWVIGFQVAALTSYAIGSYRFYKNIRNFMKFLTLGILLDIIMAIGASSGALPRMEAGQTAIWTSPLFIIHVILSGFGLFSFIFLYIYLLIKGRDREYTKLREIQFKIFLPCWIVGVSIGLINFFTKVIFEIRLYDYI